MQGASSKAARPAPFLGKTISAAVAGGALVAPRLASIESLRGKRATYLPGVVALGRRRIKIKPTAIMKSE